MNLRRIGAGVVVIGLAVAACGKAAEVLAPRLAVREAVQATFEEQKGRFTLSLVGDEADMATLFEVTDEDRKFLDVLRRSRLSVSVDSGADRQSPDDDSFALHLDLGDLDHAVELRMVDKTIYARGDVTGLMELFEADPADVAEMVQGAEHAGLDFVADAVAGRWVALDLEPLEAMAKGFADQGGAGFGMPEFGPDQMKKVIDAVSATFGEDVDVQRAGEDDAGEHYRLTVPIRRVYERLAPVFTELFKVPGMESLPPSTEVPDRSVTLDLWTDDGRVSRAELDLGQFAPVPPAGRVALRVDIHELDGAVKAPDDAVPVNVMEILGQLMAGLGMSS